MKEPQKPIPASIRHQIAAAYEQRRQRTAAERDRRVGELRRQWPQLEQMERELIAGYAMAIRQQIEGRDTAVLDADLQRKRAELADFLLRRGIPADYDQIQPVCVLCKDRGVLLDGSPCECRQTIAIPLLTATSGLPPLDTDRFELFDETLFSDTPDPRHGSISPREQVSRLRLAAQRFIDHFAEPNQRSLLFIGPPGTGKTFLMRSIARELLTRGYSVLNLAMAEFSERRRLHRVLLSSYDPDPARLDESMIFQDSLLNCDLLLLDDLGLDARHDGRYADLLAILDRRLAMDRRMIISTNIDPVRLKDAYDERLVSRLIGGFDLWRFFGDDVRRELNRRRRRSGTS